jgi:hypothetical protein
VIWSRSTPSTRIGNAMASLRDMSANPPGPEDTGGRWWGWRLSSPTLVRVNQQRTHFSPAALSTWTATRESPGRPGAPPGASWSLTASSATWVRVLRSATFWLKRVSNSASATRRTTLASWAVARTLAFLASSSPRLTSSRILSKNSYLASKASSGRPGLGSGKPARCTLSSRPAPGNSPRLPRR